MPERNVTEPQPVQGDVPAATGQLCNFQPTSRKDAQERPQDSDQRFRLLFEQSVDGIFLADPTGRYIDVNRAGCELLGYSRDEVLVRSIADVIVPEERGRIGAEVARFAGGKVTRTEWRFMRKDGSVFIGEVVAGQLPNGDLQAILRDISEPKRVEEALRQKEERLEADLAGMKRLYDLRGRLAEERDLNAALEQIAAAAAEFTKTNRATVQLTGSDGQTLEMAAHWGYVEDSGFIKYCRSQGCDLARSSRVQQVFEDLEVHPALVGTEHRRVALAEGVRAVQCTPMINRTGAFVGVLSTQFGRPHRPSEAELRLVALLASTTADFLEHRRAEEALRDREERLRKLADNLPESAVYQYVRKEGETIGRFTYLSAGIEKITGVKVEDALKEAGKLHGLILQEHRERLMQEEIRCIRTLSDFEIEVPMRRTDGKVRWMNIRSRPRPLTGGGLVWDGVLTDITERKRAEEELARHRADLERLVAERTARLQELVGELEHFSYTITHDLKAPLRAMRGFAEVASQLCVKAEAKPFLEKIASAAERMDALIRDALNYSQAVRQELPLEDVDTGALLRGILDSYPQFQAWKAQIRVETPLPVVLGNEAGLTQCFSNLLGNAVKFVKPGQIPDIRIRAELLADRPGWTRIWVEDQGIGIPREMHARLFEMFSRGSRGYEGTGIGLALVRKVVQRMGGRVGAESQEGKGSRFWMELKSGVIHSSRERATVGRTETKGGTVLYVEDEEHDATFMRMAFGAKGWESSLRVVGDGRAAIEYLSGAGKYGNRKEYPLPAVVLLDLNLPLVSGFEVLEWMRNHPDFSRTPVVVFSSSTREDDQIRAGNLGANDFVAKPNSGLEFGTVVDLLRSNWLR